MSGTDWRLVAMVLVAAEGHERESWDVGSCIECGPGWPCKVSLAASVARSRVRDEIGLLMMMCRQVQPELTDQDAAASLAREYLP